MKCWLTRDFQAAEVYHFSRAVPPVVPVVKEATRPLSRPLPNGLTEESRTLAAQIRRARDHYHLVESLLGECEFAPRNAGLLRYLGWTALSRYRRSIVEAFSIWREEERWLRSFCPTCGSFPNMAQLVGNEPVVKESLKSVPHCSLRQLNFPETRSTCRLFPAPHRTSRWSGRRSCSRVPDALHRHWP